jgi:hypothetical protein
MAQLLPPLSLRYASRPLVFMPADHLHRRVPMPRVARAWLRRRQQLSVDAL